MGKLRELVRISARVLCVAIPVGFLTIFFLYPVGSILVRGIGAGGLERLVGLLGRGSFRGVVWFTLWQAVVSTVLAVLVAWPGAHLLARRRFRGQAVLRAAVTVPFVLPTVVVGGAFLALFERFGLSDGPLRLTRTVGAILAAHVSSSTWPSCCARWAPSGRAWTPVPRSRPACWGLRLGRPSGGSPCPACGRRWPLRPQSCSCSASPRSG